MQCLICVGVSVSVRECVHFSNYNSIHYILINNKRRDARPHVILVGRYYVLKFKKIIIVISIEKKYVRRIIEREREEYNIFGTIVLKVTMQYM